LFGTCQDGGSNSFSTSNLGYGTVFELKAPHLVFTQQPTSAAPGAPISPAVTVTLENPFGSTITGDTSNINISLNSGPGSLGGTDSATLANGVATFSNLTLSAGGSYTLDAGDATNNNITAVSNSFAIATIPTITSTQVGNGSIQRSTISSISVTFNEAVTLGANAFTLDQEVLNPDGSINSGATPTNVTSNVTASLSGGGTILTLSVTPGSALDRTSADDAGFFVNGIYQLILNGSAITDAATGLAQFDNGASTPVTFASNETQSGTSQYFHVLFGDLLGTGFVNTADYRTFASDYLAQSGDANYNPALDYDGTGIINTVSFRQFARDYLVSYTY
jgi:hypothetical protein